MLKTPMFYIIWVLFLFGGLGGVFLASQWKAYGQTFMQDDRFFSIVGSCASALNAVSGMVWGWIADRYTCKLTIQLLYAMFASVAYTLLAAEEAGKAFFLIWILTSAASAFVGQMLLDRLGYHGLFFLIGGTLTLGAMNSCGRLIVFAYFTEKGEGLQDVLWGLWRCFTWTMWGVYQPRVEVGG
nr:hypothetical protein BaRGS_003582 [Batillaria attramentaria]